MAELMLGELRRRGASPEGVSRFLAFAENSPPKRRPPKVDFVRDNARAAASGGCLRPASRLGTPFHGGPSEDAMRPHTPGVLLGPGLPPPPRPPSSRGGGHGGGEATLEFVRRNAASVGATPLRCAGPPPPPPPPLKHEFYGQPPPYLHRFAARRFEASVAADAAAAAARDAAAVPPGCRACSEDERLSSLNALFAEREKVIDALRRFPLDVGRCVSRSRRKAAIEARLADVQQAVELFSKPVVYLPLNEGG